MRVKNVTRRPPSVRSAREGFAASNLLAARLVLADVQRYGGEGAGLVQWALAYMARVERDDVARIGPLFQQAATRRAA